MPHIALGSEDFRMSETHSGLKKVLVLERETNIFVRAVGGGQSTRSPILSLLLFLSLIRIKIKYKRTIKLF